MADTHIDKASSEPSGGLLSGAGATTAGLTDELIAAEAAIGSDDDNESDEPAGHHRDPGSADAASAKRGGRR